MWIRGAETVDKDVDSSVDNSNLWITRELSTGCPQQTGGYPQFYPQEGCGVVGLSKGDFASYPHIHRPYYCYYSNK